MEARIAAAAPSLHPNDSGGHHDVSDVPLSDRPSDTRGADDEPLSLADTDNGSTDNGSTDVVPPESDPRSARSPSGNRSSLSDSLADEATTGGFDTLLGKLVVTTGLVTQEEIDLCNSLLQESTDESGEPRTLSDLLVENDFVTRRQLRRLNNEFEAKKSSRQIPGYRIIRKLGSGAMATVFLARQLSLDRIVAIKVLPKKFSDNEKFIERFYKEGKAAAKLNHPNIVGAYDVGKAGEHHYFVMEYVDGETVYDRIVPQEACRRSRRRSTSSSRSPRRSSTPTSEASCTATSSPRTS